MRPERNAERVLATTRAKAKMYEFDVPESEHIEIPQSPDILFSLAIGLLGDAAAQIADMSPDVEREVVAPEVLLFSAKFFDAYLQSRLGEFANAEFPILASACFYLADNPGSSKILANQANPPPATLGSGLALLTYRLLMGDYSELPRVIYRSANPLLTAFASFLAGEGDADTVIAYAASIRREAYISGDGRELLYADLTASIVRKKIVAAATMVLPEASALPLETWRPFLNRPNFPRELWPSQRRICDAGVLRGRSAVIQMPTSAGKTRATELILRSGFLANRVSLAVIVCPFRSLCHEIRSDMAQAFEGDNVSINEATDSFQQDLSLADLLAQRTVLIVTPEKLLYLLRRDPELANSIGLVIYDEGHQFDSGARGVTYELLLTSLKLLLAATTQTILISAVIANADSISEWLLGDPGLVIDGTGLLPTMRSIAFTSWPAARGQLQYVNPEDPDDLEFFVPRVIEPVTLIEPEDDDDEPLVFPEEGDGPTIGLYLGLKLVHNGSIALFCGRKDTAANLCDKAAEVLDLASNEFDDPRDYADANEVTKIANLFSSQFGAAAAATRSAALGVFPHHASVPHGLRLSIEYAMKNNLIKLVICTSTLAQGVNLPIRYLIVTGVQQGRSRMMVRDFHNLIGRAGRAGMHTEGSIIFADNDIFDKRRSRRERWRWGSAKELLDRNNSEPSASSLSEMFEPFYYGLRRDQFVDVDVERLPELLFSDDGETLTQWADTVHAANQNVRPREYIAYLMERARVIHGIATFLLAHIEFTPEGLPERAVALAKNTLAHFLADDARHADIESVFRRVAEELLAGATVPELRTAIRRSPVAPRSVRAFQQWIAANGPALAQTINGNTLAALIAPLIVLHNTHSAIKSLSDAAFVPRIMNGWLAGEPFSTILAALSEADVRMGGNRKRPKIEDVVTICEGGLAYEGAMIIATMADLCESDEGSAAYANALKMLQRQMKCGLSTDAALAMYEAGFSDREVAKALAALAPTVSSINAAKAWARQNFDAAAQALGPFPAYFTYVLGGLQR